MLGMTRRQLLESVDSEELSEWLAFDCEYGLPDAYFQTAQLGRAALAPWANKAPDAGDFVPFFAPQRRVQSVSEHKAHFAALAAAATARRR